MLSNYWVYVYKLLNPTKDKLFRLTFIFKPHIFNIFSSLFVSKIIRWKHRIAYKLRFLVLNRFKSYKYNEHLNFIRYRNHLIEFVRPSVDFSLVYVKILRLTEKLSNFFHTSLNSCFGTLLDIVYKTFHPQKYISSRRARFLMNNNKKNRS